MTFSSSEFLFCFLPAVLLLYFNPIIKSRRYRNIILLLASIVFYAWGEPLFVFAMLLMSLINWLVGIRIGKSAVRGKCWACIAVISDIILLVVFKYLSFVTGIVAQITGNDAWIVQIALPVGISFFTFQMISYIFDVASGNARAQKNPLDVLLYITMFPQLIAGPIVRYETVQNEITGRRENSGDFTRGVNRFVFGLGKKILIANYLASVADIAFMSIDTQAVMTAWLGIVCYTLQIYFDFSGYSDMAIGLGLIFGFHFEENFRYPYTAKSVTGFWRRWHISLSTWFRDYVYIPLGGNRVSKMKWIRNLFVVWLLTGIWHGADWSFLVWGILYFAVLLTEKLLGIEKIERYRVISHIYTMLVVMLAWVIFRADNMTEAVKYMGNMVGVGTVHFVDGDFLWLLSSCKIPLCFGILFSFPVYGKITSKFSGKASHYIEAVSVAVVFVLSVFNCVQATYNPFIYFNF